MSTLIQRFEHTPEWANAHISGEDVLQEIFCSGTPPLTPTFSEEGSNRRRFEGEVYAAFLSYLRKAASECYWKTLVGGVWHAIVQTRSVLGLVHKRTAVSWRETKCNHKAQFNVTSIRDLSGGQRGDHISLNHILRFVTGVEDEPVLGFSMAPSIAFADVEDSFLPTANTCINCLTLKRPTVGTPLPTTEVLYNVFDYAFSNAYFGKI